MTTVRMMITREAPAGRVGVPGTLRCAPTRARTVAGDPDETVLPAPMAVEVGPTGRADVSLAATGPSWCWHISWRSAAGSWDEWVAVPESAAPIDWTDLVRVDPATLAPTAAPEAAWWAVADSTVSTGAVVGDDLILTRTDGTTTNVGTVRGPVGPSGPPNSLSIGTVTTGAPGSQAAATITGTAPAQTLSLTIPTGATGAVSGWEYYAAGRPDVVGTLDAAALAWRNAAPSGGTFVSTDGPQGAWVWRKRGTAWVCVEGDTEWRKLLQFDIAGTVTVGAFASAGWAPAPGRAGSIMTRRVGDTTEWKILSVAYLGAGAIISCPAGWDMAKISSTPGMVIYATAALKPILLQTFGGVLSKLVGPLAVNDIIGDWHTTSAIGTTADPWPTTLPGVAG